MISQYTFFEPVFVKGHERPLRSRLGLESGPVWRACGISRCHRSSASSRDLAATTLNAARARAWYVSGAWVVTGDRKSRVAEPRRPLFMGGAGAVELSRHDTSVCGSTARTPATRFANSRAEAILPSGDRVLTLV